MHVSGACGDVGGLQNPGGDILPPEALQQPDDLQVGLQGEVLAAGVEQVAPGHGRGQQVPHAVEVGPQAGGPAVDHPLRLRGQEGVGEAADQAPHGLPERGRRLGIHVDAVDILGHVDRPEEPLEGLELLVQGHDVGDGEGGLLSRERAGDVAVLHYVLCATGSSE